jgi:hypothetical protein
VRRTAFPRRPAEACTMQTLWRALRARPPRRIGQ